MSGDLSPGTSVRVKSLGVVGEVIEVLSNGTVRVALRGMTTVRPADDLELLGNKAASAQSKITVPDKRSGEKVPELLDLHGLTVTEAMSHVERYIDRAVLQGLHRGRIMHGLGSGRIQEAVHQLLRRIPSVARFEVSPWNPGITDVYF